jgi:hypothetical protein
MNLNVLCTAVAAALLAASSVSIAQTQSGSSIGSNTGGSATTGTAPIGAPSTGTSNDNAGAVGTTSPRSPDTSVGVSGAYSAAPTGPSSGRCDTLTGDERNKCLQEQASTGTTTPRTGSAGPGSTGMGR